MTTKFFQRSQTWYLAFQHRVSNDLDKYLPRHSIFKGCLESDVHPGWPHLWEPKIPEFSLTFSGNFQNCPWETLQRKIQWNAFSLVIMSDISHFPEFSTFFGKIPISLSFQQFFKFLEFSRFSRFVATLPSHNITNFVNFDWF